MAITFVSRTTTASLIWALLLPAALAQSAPPQSVPATREEALAADRDSKTVKELTLAKPEQVYYRVLKNPFVRGFLTSDSGVSVRFGGLYPGSSFAMGLNYTKRGLLNDNVDFSTFASGSVRLYYAAGVALSAPHLATDRIQIDYLLRRTYAPQMPYYGPGNRSSEDMRSNYMREDVLNGLQIGYKPFRRYFSLGVIGGIQQFNIGRGTSGSYPSSEDLFGPQQAPGIDRQANYTQLGPFAAINYTDDASNPHSGGRYEARYLWFHDYKFDRYSFRKVQVSAEQYIPFLNKKRVIALRAKSEWNLTDSGDQVPFYLQAYLGGPNDLRGYRQFRFYDNNSLLFNGEYRYEVTQRMDVAVFTDWGKVFSRPGQMAFSDMRGSAGFGIRLRSGGPNMIRFDVGFGPGGVKLWFSFNDIFQGFSRNLPY